MQIHYMLRLMSPLLVAVALAAEQGAGTITVPLEKKLLPDPNWEVSELQPLAGMTDGLHAFSTTLPFRKGVRVRVVLMERDGSKPVWLIDRNLDGELSPDEHIEVGPNPTVVEIPLQDEPYASFPIQVKAVDLPPKWEADMLRRNVRFIYHSHAVDVSGRVNLDGVRYDFFYRVNSNTFDVALSEAWMAVDIDRDGKIDLENWSDEMAYPLGQPVVFKIGNHYLRTDAVDTKAMTALIREVDASEYQLISMRKGRVVPEFSFVSLEGAAQSLKSAHGPRYTMLYFWASWCAICQSEIGLVDEANRIYQDRGFRVVGINGDKDAATARNFLKDHNVTFPQAKWDSVKDLVERRMRIEEWPTAILLDADLRVVSTNTKGELHIRHDGLMNTLETLLGGSKSGVSPDSKRDDH